MRSWQRLWPLGRRGDRGYGRLVRASRFSGEERQVDAALNQASPASIWAQRKFDHRILIPERRPAGPPGALSHQPSPLWAMHNYRSRRAGSLVIQLT
jgi:hypothetical protein